MCHKLLLLLGGHVLNAGVRASARRHAAHHGRVDLAARSRDGHGTGAELRGHDAARCALLARVVRDAGAHAGARNTRVSHAGRVAAGEVGAHASGHHCNVCGVGYPPGGRRRVGARLVHALGVSRRARCGSVLAKGPGAQKASGGERRVKVGMVAQMRSAHRREEEGGDRDASVRLDVWQ